MKQKPTKKCENGVQLRPASIEEAGLFYSELDQKQDEALGTVGHIRMDFGSGGKEFWHTWWPHNEDRFNTLEFKEELQAIVDTLRENGPLKDLASMSNYCHKNGGAITEDSRSFGYVAETDHYRYCLRCTPTPGDYQGYLYCYDKRQQEMAQKDKIVGRVTFADGTAQEFTDPNQYLQTIKEELPLRNTTGFKHETLSEDPEIKKAVDDILLDFAGEENPRRTCNYGLTEKGLQALRDVADPSLPHSYAWFVMTDCNTPQEQLHRNLTLDEAVELYQNSDHPEKRLGVTKDDFATVDFVRMVEGEQIFFEDYQKLLISSISEGLMEMGLLYQQDPAGYEAFFTTVPAQGSLPPEEIIAQLREASKEDFPALEELPYTVKDVPAALEEYTSPAFFMIPPIDSQDKNTIYINNSALDASSLFTTLAHEGYPGHLYQTVYSQLLDLDPLNNELSATGYAEGWATYVEHEYGYSYLDESETYRRLARLNALLSLEVSALADIGVNWAGWSEDDLAAWLDMLGFNGDVAGDLMAHVCAEPANYMAYAAGYLEFMELRKTAENTLGDTFDALEFHTWLLNQGPAPFPALADRLSVWLESSSALDQAA